MIYQPLETLVFDFSWVSKLTILLHNFGATTRCIFTPQIAYPFFQFVLGIENHPSAFFEGEGVGVTQQGVFWLNVKAVHALAFCCELVLARVTRKRKSKSIPLFYETEIPVLMTNGLFVFHLSRWVSSYRCVLQMEFTQLYWRCSVHCRGLGNASVYDNQR